MRVFSINCFIFVMLRLYTFEPVFAHLRTKRSLTEPNNSEGVDTFFDPDFVQDFEHDFSDLRYISLPQKAKRDINKHHNFGRVKSEDSDCKNGGCSTNKKNTVKVNTKRDSSDIENDINELYRLLKLQESNRRFRHSGKSKRTDILFPSSNQIRYMKPHPFAKHRIIEMPAVPKPEYVHPNKLASILQNNRHARQQHFRRSRFATLDSEDGHRGPKHKEIDIVIDRFTTYNPCVYMPTRHTIHHPKKHPHKKPPDHHHHKPAKEHPELVFKKQKHTTHEPHIVADLTTPSTTEPSVTTPCYTAEDLMKKLETTTKCYNPEDVFKTSTTPNTTESVDSSTHTILKRNSKYHSKTPMIRNASPDKLFKKNHFISSLRHKRNLLPNHETQIHSGKNSRRRRISNQYATGYKDSSDINHNYRETRLERPMHFENKNNRKREGSHFLNQS